ncbi:MAG: hypothetical protein DCC68_05765 [Planctomycetota bacterium]|nr:MAG: hypothetical protein DCC68_05765 [Planctomycetota bacterium]
MIVKSVPVALVLVAICLVSPVAFGQPPSEVAPDVGTIDPGDEQPAEEEGGIQDNSFFIEEAYNQEPGVVQHIFNWVRQWDDDDGRERTFDFVFTEEMPIGSQDHQFSFAIPFSSIYEQGIGEPPFNADGLGDIMLNYRYQLLGGEDATWWSAPRFSVILDTAHGDEGLGNGTTGYQFNLPISREFENIAFHFNAGCTIFPNAEVGQTDGSISPPTNLMGYNLGASLIDIRNKKVQPMLEVVLNWDDEVDGLGARSHEFEALISPGFRWAPYTQGSTQWVLGAAVPVGLTRDSPDVGVFLYMSFEHAVPRRCCRACACDGNY